LPIPGTPLDANKRKEHKYANQVWEFMKSQIEGYVALDVIPTRLRIFRQIFLRLNFLISTWE
jgi:hypothetical protein